MRLKKLIYFAMLIIVFNFANAGSSYVKIYPCVHLPVKPQMPLQFSLHYKPMFCMHDVYSHDITSFTVTEAGTTCSNNYIASEYDYWTGSVISYCGVTPSTSALSITEDTFNAYSGLIYLSWGAGVKALSNNHYWTTGGYKNFQLCLTKDGGACGASDYDNSGNGSLYAILNVK